jgi:hypothetical protein
MALLRPRSERRTRGLPLYTVATCPHNGHQVGWCRQLCAPVDGRGTCGRPAPHGLQGRTQRAIAEWVAARAT